MRSPLPPVALLLIARAAFAHDADVIYVELVDGPDGGFVERVTMTAATLGQLAPVDADGDGQLTEADLAVRQDAIRLGVWEQALLEPCTRSNEVARLAPGYVELLAQFQCGAGDLSQEFRWLMILPANYRVLLGSQLKGEQAATASAQGSMRTLHVPRPVAGEFIQVRTSWTEWPWWELPLVGFALFGPLAAVAFSARRRTLGFVFLGLALFIAGFSLVQHALA